MEELDEIDKSILRSLQKDATVTAKQLAARLELTVSPVYDRIKRLEKLGYIKEYVAVLNRRKFETPITTYCQVSMRYHDEVFLKKFETEVQKLPEVQECYLMAGPIDFLLKINVGSLTEYHDFVRYRLSHLENIGKLNSIFVLKEVKHTHSFNI